MKKANRSTPHQVPREEERLFEGLDTLEPNAAGIDIGSQTHYVSVPEDRDTPSVRTFGCTTPDLQQMAVWLKQCRIRSIVLESTSVYWIPVYQVLQDAGFQVSLVDARHARNVPGRKSDVWDACWLRKLHTFGLLRGCFLPPADIVELRTYWRHRQSLVEGCAQQIQRQQKALEQMNLQIHKVLSDISGVTGRRIIEAILAGERDPKKLLTLKHPFCKHSDAQILAALTGHYRAEHLFTLQQALAAYDFFQAQIAQCDAQIQTCLARFEDKAPPTDPPAKPPARRKNQPHFDLAAELRRISGVDLTRIEGIQASTAQTLLSEVGTDLSAFASEKHFASWLGLCPNHRITGGKVQSRKTRPVCNRVAKALRIAAQSLHHSKSALGAFYRRILARSGPSKAVTATAHKLARIIYRLLRYGEAYVAQGESAYEQQHRERSLRSLQKRAAEMGYTLAPAGGTPNVS